jgi:nitrogen fixation protein FixH
MDEGDAPGIVAAQAAGNKMIALDVTETARWKAAAAPIAEAWVKEMTAKDQPAAAMLQDAKALIIKYAGAE